MNPAEAIAVTAQNQPQPIPPGTNMYLLTGVREIKPSEESLHQAIEQLERDLPEDTQPAEFYERLRRVGIRMFAPESL